MSAISSDLWNGCHFRTYCREIASHITVSPESHDTSQVITSWFSDNIYTTSQIVKSFPWKLPPLTLQLFRIFKGNFVQFIVYTCSTLSLSKELIMVLISALFKLTAQDCLFSPNFYIIIKSPYSSLSKDQLPCPPSAEIKLICCPWLQGLQGCVSRNCFLNQIALHFTSVLILSDAKITHEFSLLRH